MVTLYHPLNCQQLCSLPTESKYYFLRKFVLETRCFLSGRTEFFKYYLDDLRLQRVNTPRMKSLVEFRKGGLSNRAIIKHYIHLNKQEQRLLLQSTTFKPLY
jgi:hypothetical protein